MSPSVNIGIAQQVEHERAKEQLLPALVDEVIFNGPTKATIEHLANGSYHSEMSASGRKLDYHDVYSPAPHLASSRYNRQMLIPSIALQGQESIARTTVLIVGLGGLGSPTALYLAGAGVGKLGLLDSDTVELSNLHRQVVHRESSVHDSMTKVQSAIRGCRELNSEIKLVAHDMRLDLGNREDAETVMSIVEDYDIVLDCTDNPATRYLISDLCVVLRKTLVSGAAQRLEGQIMILNYPLPRGEGRGPCYRCVFPTPPNPEMVKGCGEIGILGPVVGTIGTLMASEALRLIVRGVDEPRKPSMLMYNAWPTDPKSMFRNFGLRGRRTDCIACGEEKVLAEKHLTRITRERMGTGQIDYITFCGIVKDVKVLRSEERIDAADFLHTLASNAGTQTMSSTSNQRKWRKAMVVDVREPHEVAMGPQVSAAVNMPLSQILHGEGTMQEICTKFEEADHDAVIFVCQQGNDSQLAAKRLLDWRLQQLNSPESDTGGTSHKEPLFVGDVIGGFVALDKI